MNLLVIKTKLHTMLLLYSLNPTLLETFFFGTGFKKTMFSELNKVRERIESKVKERIKYVGSDVLFLAKKKKK